jgi:hypothetical protein
MDLSSFHSFLYVFQSVKEITPKYQKNSKTSLFQGNRLKPRTTNKQLVVVPGAFAALRGEP